MPNYHVERSILIDSPINAIRDVLKNFHQWVPWSPWLISEPDAKLDYSDKQGEPGAWYSWEGQLVGSGTMTLTNVHDQKLDMQLHFRKPFKSTAQVHFDLLPEQSATRVIWHMRGKLPFFLFFMLKTMKSWIGMDYERGLAMLKEYIETGMVLSRVEIIGKTTLKPIPYIGLSSISVLEELGDTMPPLYQKLEQFLTDHQLPTDNSPFCIYNHLNMHTKMVDFTCAVPVPKDTPIPEGFEYGELPALPVLQINHFGHYNHLGNAWSTATAYARYKKIKLRKTPKGFEYYLNDPQEVPSNALKTAIYLPLK